MSRRRPLHSPSQNCDRCSLDCEPVQSLYLRSLCGDYASENFVILLHRPIRSGISYLMKENYSLQDLRNWRDDTREADPPIRLGVVGDPVQHSLSPQMQNRALRECAIGAQYGRFHISAAELRECLGLIQRKDFIGVNLTLPHKIAAAQLVDELATSARDAGAVNTVAVVGGKLVGHNTDGLGFAQAFRGAFHLDLRDLRVLVLGAGGAARAIAIQCASERCERLVIAARSAEKARKLTKELSAHFVDARVLGPVARLQAISLDEPMLRAQIPNIDVVVNATPLGLRPGDPAIVPARVLAPHLVVFDTVPLDQTPLTRAARDAGARAIAGKTMLLHQGAAAFEIWFSRSAPVEAMRAALAGI
jgi:shikimate dehydrogenase